VRKKASSSPDTSLLGRRVSAQEARFRRRSIDLPFRSHRGTPKRFTINDLQIAGGSGLSLTLRVYLDTVRATTHLYCVMLLSGSIATVAKKDTYIPSRRTGKGPLGAKVFSYYTQDERRLVEKAAKLEHRSLSSFVAIAAVERAQRVLGRN
jgi:hypothetical protein